MSDISAADLVFSDQANHNFSRILADLKRSNLSISNRFSSIRQDADFVDEVAAALGRPLVANERCGSWYVAPASKAGSAYFKSTDGHTGQWKFSTRRLNLHLLSLIGEHDGCIIVDSTRRGKRMPDALSKTVPIWCCVLSRVLFPDDPSLHNLYVPPNAVSSSEQSQMLARIPGFVESFRRLGIDAAALRARVEKPLRPMWVTQETQLAPADDDDEIFASFHPVVCCTSSRRVEGAEMSEGGYIQGAGDDTENWALGLTAPLWWAHAEELLTAPEGDLPDIIARLVAQPAAEESGGSTDAGGTTRLTKHISVGRLTTEKTAGSPHCCRIELLPEATKAEDWGQSGSHMRIGVGKHKVASRNLRPALPQICSFVSEFLSKNSPSPGEDDQRQILVTCESGRDISVGVALALFCYCFDDGGNVRGPSAEKRFNKDMIRVRLGKIMTTMPEANPNRATLQSVNSFLMDWR